MAHLKKAVCIINDKKIHALPFVMQTAEGLERKGIQVIPAITGSSWSTAELLAEDRLDLLATEKPDLALVFGGDGSIIQAARLLAPLEIPLLGINLGSLGFLAQVEPADVPQALERLATCDYVIQERMLVEGTVYREGKSVFSSLALNDIVVRSQDVARNILLDVMVDGEWAASYRGDGVIIASSTGSTAYSLSAGGPMIMPDLDLFIVTPISAHTLHARPFIAGPERLITLTSLTQGRGGVLVADGQRTYNLQPDDQVQVKRYAKKARFIDLFQKSFFATLRQKLYSGGEPDGNEASKAVVSHR